MNLTERNNLCSEFVKDTNIVEESFSKLNLKVMSITYDISDDSESIKCWIEICSLDGARVKLPPDSEAEFVMLKMNVYINNRIADSRHASFNAKNFIGYDTLEVKFFLDSSSLLNITNFKLYAILADNSYGDD